MIRIIFENKAEEIGPKRENWALLRKRNEKNNELIDVVTLFRLGIKQPFYIYVRLVAVYPEKNLNCLNN